MVANDGGGVEETATGGQIRRSHGADDCCDSFCCVDDLWQRFECAALYVFVQEPIERCISLDAGFGKDDEVGVLSFCLFNAANNARGIAFEIAVDGVDLADGDFQVSSLGFQVSIIKFQVSRLKVSRFGVGCGFRVSGLRFQVLDSLTDPPSVVQTLELET